jgi:DNA-binding transcriptional LysR family regulator
MKPEQIDQQGPSMPEPTLRDLRIALLVAETRSFRRAARRLDIAPSTVSHTITGLEGTLGLRLFHRTTRSVATTTEGIAFLARVKPFIEGIDAAIAEPTSDPRAVSGVLRINTPFSAASYLLQTVVPTFMDQYPQIEVELRHEERMVDIVAEGCDAGIRLGSTVPGDMIGVRFGGPLRWVPVAAPSYLRRRGKPEHPRELMNHRCIRIRMPNGERYLWEFGKDGEEFRLDVPGSLTLDRMALMAEAAANGFGIAYVLQSTVEQRLAVGELTLLLPDWCSYDEDYMLYYSGRRAVMPQLRVFIDFIRLSALVID